MNTVTTQRLLLKVVTPALIKELFTTQDRSQIMERLGLDDTGYEKYLTMYEQGAESYRISMCSFVLFDKQTHRSIGECGYHTWNKAHFKAELFYHIHKEEDRNKGYISEALTAVLEYGFLQMQLHRVHALLADFNTPSVKLVQRFGFTKEGTLREDYLYNGKFESSDCYSLLRAEWEEKRSLA